MPKRKSSAVDDNGEVVSPRRSARFKPSTAAQTAKGKAPVKKVPTTTQDAGGSAQVRVGLLVFLRDLLMADASFQRLLPDRALLVVLTFN